MPSAMPHARANISFPLIRLFPGATAGCPSEGGPGKQSPSPPSLQPTPRLPSASSPSPWGSPPDAVSFPPVSHPWRGLAPCCLPEAAAVGERCGAAGRPFGHLRRPAAPASLPGGRLPLGQDGQTAAERVEEAEE